MSDYYSDEVMRRILEQDKTIAVVGFSRRTTRAGWSTTSIR